MPNKTQTVINQFVINDIISVPCEGTFLNLLPQTCLIERPYDADEGVKKVNEFGEVVMTYAVAQTVGTDIPVRVENISQRGKMGFGIEVQGGEVRAMYRMFFCPNIDITENDSVVIGSRKYQVLLVSTFYDYDSVHHLEVLLRETSHL